MRESYAPRGAVRAQPRGPRRSHPIPARARVAACVALAALACGPSDAPPVAPPATLAVGTWGGENAGLVVDDSAAHLHIGCTLGDFPAPVRLDRAGRFTVAGGWVLRAFPIVLGPRLPARLVGTLEGEVLTLRVTVDDTVSRSTVELGPVTVAYRRDPRLGPCPICRTPRRRAAP